VRNPLAVAACPVGAIKPAKEITAEKGEQKTVNSVEINEERCMFCGNCYTMCPSLPLADKEGDCIVLMVGGKVSNRMSNPKFSKVVVAFLPNNPPAGQRLTSGHPQDHSSTPRAEEVRAPGRLGRAHHLGALLRCLRSRVHASPDRRFP
jgi:ferredoxin